MRQHNHRREIKMKRHRYLLAVTVFSLLSLFVSSCSKNESATEIRSISWSEPIELEGLPNFHKVSEGLYRGGQPEENGIKHLKKLGIKTVVNLRTHDTDRAMLKNTTITYVRLPFSVFWPKEKVFTRFLKIAKNPSRQPVFVHCKHGSDRTGAAVALYRIFIQGWQREEAIREMTAGGFGFHKVHNSLKDFVREFEFSEAEAPVSGN